MDQGIYDLSEQEHRSLTQYPSISELKLLSKAPMLFKHSKQSTSKSMTKAQLEGVMFHMAILEPEKYASSVRLFPEDVDFRTKEGKALKAEIISEKQKGIEYLPRSLIDRIADCRNDIYSNPLVRDLLDGCEVEKSVVWRDPNYNLMVRGRLDAYHEERGYVLDIKTIADVDSFEKQVLKYGYHKQAAFYIDGLKANLKKDFDFYWLAVEKNAPFLYRILKADKTMLDVGQQEYKKLLELYCHCEKENKWPGLGDKVEVLSLPEWYMQRYSAVQYNYDTEEHDG